MPKILLLTLAHAVAAIICGLMLGLSIFGVGFSDSALTHASYSILVIIWEILNAPAGIYILQVSEPSGGLWLLLQVLTSFLWANSYALVASYWKASKST